MAIEAYPLCWPMGRPRAKRPERSRFDTTFAMARDCLVDEIRLLGGRDVIISTNIPLRRDGLPYAGVKEPEDSGVAVYFTYNGSQHCFACDQWDRVKDNIQAARKTIEALRGIARWGTGDMMERAFTGFAALPDPATAGGEPWYFVLDVHPGVEPDEIQRAYRRAAARTHPDRPGGNAQEFDRVQRAWEQARQERGL